MLRQPSENYLPLLAAPLEPLGARRLAFAGRISSLSETYRRRLTRLLALILGDDDVRILELLE